MTEPVGDRQSSPLLAGHEAQPPGHRSDCARFPIIGPLSLLSLIGGAFYSLGSASYLWRIQ